MLCKLGFRHPQYLEDYWREARAEHLTHAFPDVWNDINITLELEKQPWMEHSSRRLVYKWIRILCQKGALPCIHTPHEVASWEKGRTKECMYPSLWSDRPITHSGSTMCVHGGWITYLDRYHQTRGISYFLENTWIAQVDIEMERGSAKK